MANQGTTGEVVQALASGARVLTLGGGAVIAHGHSRNTLDVDIWVEPFSDAESWSDFIHATLKVFPSISLHRIERWEVIESNQLASVIESDGMVRIYGLERPLDIFRRPNEFDIGSFEEVWTRATSLIDGTRLPDIIDLLVTKQLTGRAKDQMDILFLEQKAEARSLDVLTSGSTDEILALLDRFLTPNLAATAARHADPKVSQIAREYLRELADEGDPFAADLLREL